MVGHNRYRLLDELRGLAALVVLIFHLGTRGGGPVLFPNGYLAVDFFFMLSGFVIAEAYEPRLVGAASSGSPNRRPPAMSPAMSPRMSLGAFTLRRLIRMVPVAMLGALIGGLYLLARYFAAPARSDPLVEVLVANGLNMLILPKLWHGSATDWELFPANGPLWSLFFEIVMNLAWAAFLVGRSTALVALFVAASAALMVACGFHFGTLHLGWEVGSLIGGAARVSFGFGAGLLLHRCRARMPVLGRNAALAALMALVYFLALPVTAIGWTLAVVLVCLPAVMMVAVAAGREVVLPGGALLGRLSYPLYGIHLPLIAAICGAIKFGGNAQSSGSGGGNWALLLLVPVLLAVSYGVLVLFDEPLRARLMQRLLPAPRKRADSSTGRPHGPVYRTRRRPSGRPTASELNLSLQEESARTG